MKKDLHDNMPDNCNPATKDILDRGVNTGVTDTYGGGLDKGYQNANKIDTGGLAGVLEYN
jgi:hypothetical protein